MMPLHPTELLLLLALLNAALYLVFGIARARKRVPLVAYLATSMVLGAATYLALVLAAALGTHWELGWEELLIWGAASLVMLLGFIVVNAVFAVGVYGLGQGGAWVLTRPVPLPVSRRPSGGKPPKKKRPRREPPRDKAPPPPGRSKHAVPAPTATPSPPTPEAVEEPAPTSESKPDPVVALEEQRVAPSEVPPSRENATEAASRPVVEEDPFEAPSPAKPDPVAAIPERKPQPEPPPKPLPKKDPPEVEAPGPGVREPDPPAVEEPESAPDSEPEEIREPEATAKADTAAASPGMMMQDPSVEQTILAALASVSGTSGGDDANAAADEPEPAPSPPAPATASPTPAAPLSAPEEVVSRPVHVEPPQETEAELQAKQDQLEKDRKKRIAEAELKRKRGEWETRQRQQAEEDAWGE